MLWGSAALFYRICPDHCIHQSALLPIGINYWLDNIIHLPCWFGAVFFCWRSWLEIPLIIFAGIGLLLKLRRYETAFLLGGVFLLLVPGMFLFSKTCDYVSGSILFGMHRFYLFLFPLIALILFLERKESAYFPRCRTWLIVGALTAAVAGMTGYKMMTFPCHHDIEDPSGHLLGAVASISQIESFSCAVEEKWKETRPSGIVVTNSVFAYTLAAKMYGKCPSC